MIKWIFFDIDDTLFDSKELAYHSRMNAVKAMISAGLPEKDPEKIYQELLKIIKEKGSNYGKHYDDLLEIYGMRSSQLVASAVVAYHNTKMAYLKPFPDVVPTLLELEKKYKLGVITNGRAVKQWDKLIRLGLQHFFEEVIISEEVGVLKPDEKIFRVALGKAGCEPKEAIMVGDKESDIAPARELGIGTICVGDFDSDFTVKNFSEVLEGIEKIGS